MSFLNRLKERVEQAALTTAEKVGILVAEEPVIQTRVEICNNCENLYKPTRNCKLCGCFIDLKTKLQSSSCPINKW